MAAILGGGEAVPASNAGMMSGASPEAGTSGLLGVLAANGGRMNEETGKVEGLMQNLNPVQKVGLQGLLGALQNPRQMQQDTIPQPAATPVAQAPIPPIQQPPQPTQQGAPQGFDWNKFHEQGHGAVSGINNMPYMLSSYQQMNGMALPDIMKMMYPTWDPNGPKKPEEATGRVPGGGGEALPMWGF